MTETLVAMISSTAWGLKRHRAAAVDACLRQKVQPRMMEHEPPADRDATALSLAMVDEADVYVLILGFRYGAVPPGGEKSYTHLELDHARMSGKPTIVLLMSEEHDLRSEDVETGPGAQKIRALRKELASDKVIQYFHSVDDMRARLVSDLAAMRERLTPRVAATASPRSGPLPPEPFRAHPYTLLRADEVVGRRTELNALKGWLTDPTSPLAGHHALVLTAIGGMGKSAIAWKWFQDVVPTVSTVSGRIWWSFYDRDSHFDTFVLRSLAYVTRRPVSDVRAASGTAERMDELLDALDRERFVVVLDGLERLLVAYSRPDAAHVHDNEVEDIAKQGLAELRGTVVAAGSYAGMARLRTATDPRVGTFLRRLAALSASQILITSRLYPSELQHPDGRPIAGSTPYLLDGLTDADALALWRESGSGGDDAELVDLFHAFGNYPLLIAALSAEVAGFRPAPGDYSAWRQANPGFDPFQPSLLTVSDRKSHVLRYALQGLTEVERPVLQIVAAFTAPVAFGTLRALVMGPGRIIASDAELDRVLTALEDRGLLGWDRAGARYDLHPVVRGVAFAGLDQAAQRAIYGRLADHFGSAPELNDKSVTSIEDLTDRIELYHTLIRLGRIEDAFGIMRNDLLQPLLRMAAFTTAVELAEAIEREPDWSLGWDNEDMAARARRMIPLWIALFSFVGGDPTRAAQHMQTIVFGKEDRAAYAFEAIIRMQLGELATAERLVRESISASDMSLPAIAIGSLLLRLGRETEGCRWLRDYRIDVDEPFGVEVSLIELAWAALRREDLREARTVIERLAEMATHTRDVRTNVSSVALTAALARRGPDQRQAGQQLTDALTIARASRLVDEEIAVRIEMAHWHADAGAVTDARAQLTEAAELAERRRLRLRHSDVMLALAQIECAVGNPAAAVAAAEHAYRLAFCDGGRHCYRPVLDEAQRILSAATAPEPVDLPTPAIEPFTPIPADPAPLGEVLIKAAARGDIDDSDVPKLLKILPWTPPTPELTQALVLLASSEIDVKVRDAARETLSHIEVDTADAAVAAATAAAALDPLIRQVATRLLLNLEPPDVEGAIAIARGDEDWTVRAAALEELADLPHARSLLIDRLSTDVDETVRITSAWLLLARHPDTRFAVELQAVNDPIATVRGFILLLLAGQTLDTVGEWFDSIANGRRPDTWPPNGAALSPGFLDTRVRTETSISTRVIALLLRYKPSTALRWILDIIEQTNSLNLGFGIGAIAAIGAEDIDPEIIERVEQLAKRNLPVNSRVQLIRWLQEAGRKPEPAMLESLLYGFDAESRRRAVEGLATDLDRVDQLLVTVDLNGDRPYLDPLQPIGLPRLKRAAEKTEETVEQVRARYERLATQFLFKLDLITSK
jgi:hypothetical protein